MKKQSRFAAFGELSTPLVADAALRRKIAFRIAPPGIKPVVPGARIAGDVAALPIVLTSEYSRVSSPDGRFCAVATFSLWQRYVSMKPGQVGDKSGCVTVYTADGRSCGRAPVKMVSFIRDLEWSTDRAEIRLVAEWDLSKRRVQRLQ